MVRGGRGGGGGLGLGGGGVRGGWGLWRERVRRKKKSLTVCAETALEQHSLARTFHHSPPQHHDYIPPRHITGTHAHNHTRWHLHTVEAKTACLEGQDRFEYESGCDHCPAVSDVLREQGSVCLKRVRDWMGKKGAARAGVSVRVRV